jgi:Ca2+-binding RTX toxin-like protein
MTRCGLSMALVLPLSVFALNVMPARAALVDHNTGSFVLLYSASLFETSTVSITFANDTFTVTDTTATLDAGVGCVSVDVHTVTCLRLPPGWDPSSGILRVHVALGDLNDSATSSTSFETLIRGEDGDDVLTYTGTGIGGLEGGNGNDTLRTPSGGDSHGLQGGPGDDQLTDGPSHSHLFGGDGDDTLRGGGGPDCLLGEGGQDVLLGGARRDAFSGGPGRDILRGGSGNDFLRGDEGFDRMYGNTGKDAFSAHDFHRDRLSGGGGLDRAFLDRLLDTRLGIETLVSRRGLPEQRCF